MIYTHVLKSGAAGTTSPLDGLMTTMDDDDDDDDAATGLRAEGGPAGRPPRAREPAPSYRFTPAFIVNPEPVPCCRPTPSFTAAATSAS